MSRFKFRAWDTITQMMIDPVTIEEKNLYEYIFNSGNCYVLQSSSMRDNQKNLIFEHDFVEVYTPKGKGIAKVTLTDGCFELQASKPILLGPNPHRDYLKCYTCNPEVRVRVIGNIFLSTNKRYLEWMNN